MDTEENDRPASGDSADRAPDRAERVPRFRSRDLFGDSRRVVIDHNGKEYFLLLTRQGKLILNRGL